MYTRGGGYDDLPSQCTCTCFSEIYAVIIRTEHNTTQQHGTSLNSTGQIVNSSAKIAYQYYVIFIMTHERLIQWKDIVLLPTIANGFIMCFANNSLASVKKDLTLSSGALPLWRSSMTVPPGVMKAETRSELNLSTTRRNLTI